jgi:hypothetical protein
MLSVPVRDRIRRWTVRVDSRVDAVVVEGVSLPEASGHRGRCPVGGRCNGGANGWRVFPALGRCEYGYATDGYDCGACNDHGTRS